MPAILLCALVFVSGVALPAILVGTVWIGKQVKRSDDRGSSSTHESGPRNFPRSV